MEAGLLGPDVLVAMHVGDENLVRILEPPQKARLLAITAVDADPREPDRPGARPAHDVEGSVRSSTSCARPRGSPPAYNVPVL